MKRSNPLILFLLLTFESLLGQDGDILSREQIDLLQRAELTNTIFDYKDGDRYIKPDLAYLKEVDDMVVEWFDRYVKNGEPLPDLVPHGK